jgi:hypothetical protein
MVGVQIRNRCRGGATTPLFITSRQRVPNRRCRGPCERRVGPPPTMIEPATPFSACSAPSCGQNGHRCGLSCIPKFWAFPWRSRPGKCDDLRPLVQPQAAEMRADVVRNLPSGHRVLTRNTHQGRRLPPSTMIIYVELPRRSQRETSTLTPGTRSSGARSSGWRRARSRADGS